MTMEKKLKDLLGELLFQIASLQFQMELLQKENEELKNKMKDLTKDQTN